MNTTRHLVMLVAALFSSAATYAQLIHATFEGTFVLRLAGVPMHEPAPFHIEAFYDSTLPGFLLEDTMTFYVLPEGYELHQMSVPSEGHEYRIPITFLQLSTSNDFILRHADRGSDLEVRLHLGPNTSLDRLPLPPFTLSPTASELGVISGFNTLQHQVRYDDFIGTITRVEAEFVPVPEPNAYAVLAASALLTLVVLRRRIAPTNGRAIVQLKRILFGS